MTALGRWFLDRWVVLGIKKHAPSSLADGDMCVV